MIYSSRGFTLVEMIVVMAMFVIVIAAAGNTFSRIMRYSAQEAGMAESNIEGVVGLEMMRKDISSAGFGLPWSFQAVIAYKEVNPAAGDREAIAAAYNGAPDTEAQTEVPRAVWGGDNVTPGNPVKLIQGSDYLVIRATSLGESATAQRWSFMNYTGQVRPSPVLPQSWNRDNLSPTDWVSVIRVGLSGSFTKELVMNGASFTAAYGNMGAFEPDESKVTHYVYGISDSGQPRMPFNRADYYVRVPAAGDEDKLPQRCAPNTGVLYKAVVDHSDGTVTSTESPVLDCVADMQVVYVLDSLNNGVTTETGDISALTAREIREQLKVIQVYILTHEGGRERLFTYPNKTVAVGPSADGGITSGTGRTFDLETAIGTEWRQYRWKTYRVIVKPANFGETIQ